MSSPDNDPNIHPVSEKKVDPTPDSGRGPSQDTVRDDGTYVENVSSKEAAEMQLKSLYDRLSRWETIKRFKKVNLVYIPKSVDKHADTTVVGSLCLYNDVYCSGL